MWCCPRRPGCLSWWAGESGTSLPTILAATLVSTLDGLTYERIAIETWLATNDTSPLTGEQLASKMLIPNFLARGQIRELLEQHPGLDA